MSKILKLTVKQLTNLIGSYVIMRKPTSTITKNKRYIVKNIQFYSYTKKKNSILTIINDFGKVISIREDRITIE